MYRKLFALAFCLAFFQLGPAAAQTDDKLVFIHTADLGDVIHGISDDPLAPTLEEASRVLRELKQLHPTALFLDSGNIHGARVMLETQFSPPAKALLNDLEPFAINFGSRDMLYSQAHHPGIFGLSLKGLPLTSTADFPQAPEDFVVQRQIEKRAAGRSMRALGLGSVSRAKDLLKVTSLYEKTDQVSDKAVAYLTDPATPQVELNLILSDLPPEENDALARRIPANSLIFEQAIYGIDPGQAPPPVRQTAGITIVSKSDWWSADVIEVRLSSTTRAGGPVTVTAAKVVERRPYNPWFKAPKTSWLKRLFAKKPAPPPEREAVVEIPNIGERLRSYNNLRRMDLEFDEIIEFRARDLPGAEQRKFANVYFYRMMKDGERLGDFMKVYRSIIPTLTTNVVFVGFDKQGKICHIKPFGIPMMGYTETLVYRKYLDGFIGKSAKEISLLPSQMFGVEFQADYLVKDLRTACDLYQRAKRRAKEITDDQDFEDLIRR